jgi:hypothetical protein
MRVHGAAIVLLLALVLGGLVLALAPLDVGAVRLAGVSVLWWYAAVLVPLVGVAVTTGRLLASAARPRTPDAPARRRTASRPPPA